MSQGIVPSQSIDRIKLETTRSMDMDHAHLTTSGRSPRTRLVAGWHFTRHLFEMIVAMLIGMELFGIATMLLGSPPGDDTLLGGYAYMGFAMAMPMAAWMRFRGHGWGDCGEMCAAMLAPFFALVLPVALGMDVIPGLTAQSLMVPAHSAMILGMILLMLCRFDRYAHGHGAHHHGAAPAGVGVGEAARAADPA